MKRRVQGKLLLAKETLHRWEMFEAQGGAGPSDRKTECKVCVTFTVDCNTFDFTCQSMCPLRCTA